MIVINRVDKTLFLLYIVRSHDGHAAQTKEAHDGC